MTSSKHVHILLFSQLLVYPDKLGMMGFHDCKDTKSKEYNTIQKNIHSVTTKNVLIITHYDPQHQFTKWHKKVQLQHEF